MRGHAMYRGRTCMPLGEDWTRSLRDMLARGQSQGHTLATVLRLLTSVAAVPARSALRASSSGDLVVPRTRRRIGDTAFSVAAPRAWNRLPTLLKLLRSTITFHIVN